MDLHSLISWILISTNRFTPRCDCFWNHSDNFFGIRTFPLPPPIPLEHYPPDNCYSWNSRQDNYPLNFYPHRQLSLNSSWTIAHNKIPPSQLPPGLVPPGHLFPPEQLSPENCPIKFFPEQRTSALDNYPLIIYRWLSKKTLSTHSNIRSNPENKYIFKVNNINIRRRCDMFKINDNDSRTMTSFCSVVDTGQ